MQKFACDSPSDIWLSYHYLEKTASSLKPHVAKKAMDNIKKYASWMDVNLNSQEWEVVTKTAHEINPDDFAVATPVENLSEDFLAKNASYIYNEHFTLYPLNNDENVKKANFNFPNGLNDDLEGLRPQVARSINRKMASLNLNSSDKVKQYLPIKKSAAIQQLNHRAYKYNDYADEYIGLKDHLTDELSDEGLIKFASDLEDIDNKVGMSSVYDSGVISPLRFLSGIEDDTDYSGVMVKIASDRSYRFMNVLFKEANLKSIFPNATADVFKSPQAFSEFIQNNPPEQNQAIERLINT
jgi:hypothetical protein